MFQRIGEMRAIDIGDEMQARAVMIGSERQNRHCGAQIGTANADIHHIADALAAGRGDGARTDAGCEIAHGGKHATDLRHHILASDADRPVGAVAQGDMQYGALLAGIDEVACEHLIAFAGNIARFGEIMQELHGLCRHRAFRPVEQHIIEAEREAFEP